MRRQENVKSKTIRMDGDLAEQVIAVLRQDEQPGFSYRKLNFSEAVRYGLVLVLAAYGESYTEPEGYNRMKITSSYRSNQTLDKAKGLLLADHQAKLLTPKGREVA